MWIIKILILLETRWKKKTEIPFVWRTSRSSLPYSSESRIRLSLFELFRKNRPSFHYKLNRKIATYRNLSKNADKIPCVLFYAKYMHENRCQVGNWSNRCNLYGRVRAQLLYPHPSRTHTHNHTPSNTSIANINPSHIWLHRDGGGLSVLSVRRNKMNFNYDFECTVMPRSEAVNSRVKLKKWKFFTLSQNCVRVCVFELRMCSGLSAEFVCMRLLGWLVCGTIYITCVLDSFILILSITISFIFSYIIKKKTHTSVINTPQRWWESNETISKSLFVMWKR